MKRFLLIFAVLVNWFVLLSWKAPDYRRTCAYAQTNLDERAKKGLPELLDKRSLEDIATHISKAAHDSIDHYIKPINELRLGGPYKYRQLDSALRPLDLDILNGIKRFEHRFNDHSLSNNERVFALQVLIGLHTAMELPLQGVISLLPRNEFIKHDIFIQHESPKYGKTALIALMLYDAYKLGVRVRQAEGNQRIVASCMERGYEKAGSRLAGSIKDAFRPEGLAELGEGPNWGRIIEPGKEPIYYFGATPDFPGGQPCFYKFMNKYLHYPAEEWDKGIEGTCYINIVVEKDGLISEVKVASGITPGIDSEVVRVIRMSPKWQPGHLEIDGSLVRSQWMCIVNFRIKPDQKREDAFNTPLHDNIKPEFPGGKIELEKYIKSNITYTGPPYGRVTLRYTVTTAGKVTDVTVLRSLSPAADAEVIQMLKQSAPWKPGLVSGITKAEMDDILSVWFPPK